MHLFCSRALARFHSAEAATAQARAAASPAGGSGALAQAFASRAAALASRRGRAPDWAACAASSAARGRASPGQAASNRGRYRARAHAMAQAASVCALWVSICRISAWIAGSSARPSILRGLAMGSEPVDAGGERVLRAADLRHGRAARGHGEGVADLVALVGPGRGHQALRRADGGGDVPHARVGLRRKADAAEAGVLRVRLDARADVEHPLAHRAVGVVVEAVHVRGPHGAVGLEAVPVLPHGGGAAGDGVEPGGELRLQQQRVGQVRIAVLREGAQQVGRADKAGLELVAVFVDLLRQARGVGGLLVHQVKGQRQDVAGLRVAEDAAGLRGVALLPGRADVVVERLVFGHVLAQGAAHLDEVLRRQGEERAGDQPLVRRCPRARAAASATA